MNLIEGLAVVVILSIVQACCILFSLKILFELLADKLIDKLIKRKVPK